MRAVIFALIAALAAPALADFNDKKPITATATGTEVRLANEGQSPYSKPLKGKFSYVMQLYDNQFIHFLMTKDDPVFFQITGVGPSGTKFVDPARDPRKK